MKKKDSNLMTFVRGFIIGLGVIFPISASVLAIVMGIYKKLLKIINNFFSMLKKETSFVISLVLGIIVSCIVSCLLIDYTLNLFPIATLLFFIGLIMGGIPMLVKKTNKEYKVSNFIWTIIGMAILIAISFISGSENAIISTDISGLMLLFVVGMVGAGSMIVPGVSGSVMLVIMGYYEPLLEVISQTVKFHNLFDNILIIGVFGLGMLIGVIIMSRLMEFFLNKYETKSYFAIIGFVIASTVNVIVRLFNYNFRIWEVIIGALLFIVGYVISAKYLKEE